MGIVIANPQVPGVAVKVNGQRSVVHTLRQTVYNRLGLISPGLWAMDYGLIAAASLTLLLFTMCSPTIGQNISKKAQKFYDEGSEHLQWDRFGPAENAFLKAIEIEPEYTAALEKLAYVYVQTMRHEDAYKIFSKLIAPNPKNANELYLGLAKLCLATYRFDEGLEYLKRFKENGGDAAKTKSIEDNLTFAKAYLAKNPVDAKKRVEPLNKLINTDGREYFPTITADGDKLFFTRHITGENKLVNEDIFYSLWLGKDWGEPHGLPNVNTPSNEAAPAISPDGRRLYLTICESYENIGSCDIWVSYKVGDEWSKPTNIGQPVNSVAKETQPCISGDGRSLYFCSNRKGGEGGLDIWVTELQKDGKWSEPENLGSQINTPLDEQRPFIHPDNKTLYFSSDGLPGFGNADIFMSVRKGKGSWQKPVNIGPPINSYGNEEGIFVSLDGKTGYFASDRYDDVVDEKRNFDIYSFNLGQEVKPSKVTYVKGVVFDDETKEKIAADIQFIDLSTKVPVNKTTSDEKNGEYLLTLEEGKSYAMNISKPGYLFHSQNFTLDKAKPGQSFKLNADLKKIKTGQKAALRNIFFEFNSASILPESQAELEILMEFMKSYPALKIEIEGHTDNVGKPAYNQNLSEQRAKSVYDFLIAQGIEQGRLTYRGYGETQPVATNDTEEGRAQNRRTEFRITTAQ